MRDNLDYPGPQRPADASFIMLGLLPSWAVNEHPPTHGVELAVAARDRRPTIWRLSEGLAIAVGMRLRRDRRITHMKATYYDDTETA